VLDDQGMPKAAYHHLARALAPVCVWTTDEALAGIALHVANDRATDLRALLRVDVYAGFERRVGEARTELELGAHSQRTFDVEGLLGRFVDASWAYRFGPPAQDLIVTTLQSLEPDGAILSQAFRFPAGRPEPQAAGALGLSARVHGADTQAPILTLASDVLAWGVRVHASGFEALNDAVSVEPGGQRELRLRPLSSGSRWSGGHVTALNLDGTVEIESGA
jgi:beta-mannosidase